MIFKQDYHKIKVGSIHFFFIKRLRTIIKNLSLTAIIRRNGKDYGRFLGIILIASIPNKAFLRKLPFEPNFRWSKISKSRQHYLKMTLPDTYSTLMKCGIRRDYTMGNVTTIPGFRTVYVFIFLTLTNKSLKIFHLRIGRYFDNI